MQVEIVHGPGNSAAKLGLAPGETCTAEGGAMIAMSGDVAIQTTTHTKGSGNLLQAAKRLLADESFFLNHYSAGGSGGEVLVAATLPGDMFSHELASENLIVQGGSFVACEQGVSVDVGWQGFKSFLSGESIFWVNLSGSGKVVVNSFGAIYPVKVNGEYVVDTGHIVAFNEGMQFEISKAGASWISSFLGGEGLVCRFRGKGTVWCQSHSPSTFGRTLGPHLRPR
jgi:uncharacterized protein (TIGR00266 family)